MQEACKRNAGGWYVDMAGSIEMRDEIGDNCWLISLISSLISLLFLDTRVELIILNSMIKEIGKTSLKGGSAC